MFESLPWAIMMYMSKHLHTFHCMETNNLPSFFVERNYAFSFSPKHQTKPSKKLTCPPKNFGKQTSQQKNHSPQKIPPNQTSYIYPLNKNQKHPSRCLLEFCRRKKPTKNKKTNDVALPRDWGGCLWHTSTQLPGDSRHPSGQGDSEGWWVDGCWTKNRGGKTPKWRVQNNGKPGIKMGWFGGKTHYFWKHPWWVFHYFYHKNGF